MRAVTFTLDRPDSPHIAYRLFETDPVVEQEEIYHLNVLADESVVLLARVSGDVESATRLLEERPEILGYSLSSGEDHGGLLYVHARPPPEIKQFLTLPRTHEVFFDFPLESTSDGRLRVVMLGETNEILQDALAEVPAELDATSSASARTRTRARPSRACLQSASRRSSRWRSNSDTTTCHGRRPTTTSPSGWTSRSGPWGNTSRKSRRGCSRLSADETLGTHPARTSCCGPVAVGRSDRSI
jgi:hypothetical protein